MVKPKLKIVAIVPIKNLRNSKSRLSSILDPFERMILVNYFFDLTIKKLEKSSLISEILVISNTENFQHLSNHKKITNITDHREGVNNAISTADSYLETRNIDASIVIPIDLPLISSKDINDLCEISNDFSNGVIICPSKRYDGTNILLRKPHNIIKTHYDNNSYYNHLLEARLRNVFVKQLTYPNLTFDIDTKEDLVSLMKIGNWKDVFKKIGIKFSV